MQAVTSVAQGAAVNLRLATPRQHYGWQGCHSPLPAGCQIGHMQHTGCHRHHLMFCLQKT
jgi:hypothetical protein